LKRILSPVRVLGSRFWVLGSGFRVLGSGFRVLGSRFWVLGSGFSAAAGLNSGLSNRKRNYHRCIALFSIVGAVCSPELVEGSTAIYLKNALRTKLA
jgi:hypothetical protein